MIRRVGVAILTAFIATSSITLRALPVETLRSIGGLPPHIVGLFDEPAAFQQSAAGDYFVFDRRGHSVYMVDPARQKVRKVIEIGREEGRIINPGAFDLAPAGYFALADAPSGRERIQMFGPAGDFVSGFLMPGRMGPRVSIGNNVLNGVGSLQFTGQTFFISEPESGALFIELSKTGGGLRSFGSLRSTGFEQDRDLHMAMNSGLPLVDPTGGYFFVFVAGQPIFRKYDANGELVFERHIEGVELDAHVASLPTRWPVRKVEDREVPFVTSTIRAAAVDSKGQLWISLTVPYTYVYDAKGDKIRTVQFSAAGTLSPNSLFFTPSGRLLVTPGCYEFNPTQPPQK